MWVRVGRRPRVEREPWVGRTGRDGRQVPEGEPRVSRGIHPRSHDTCWGSGFRIVSSSRRRVVQGLLTGGQLTNPGCSLGRPGFVRGPATPRQETPALALAPPAAMKEGQVSGVRGPGVASLLTKVDGAAQRRRGPAGGVETNKCTRPEQGSD